jgi:hypothetical protein
VGEDEARDPLHFARSLVEAIERSPGQELATHTFSHYYCLEPEQTAEEFTADLKAAVAIASARGATLRSIVFPRNQHNPAYSDVLRALEIRAYRGNPTSWMWRFESGDESVTRTKRLARLVRDTPRRVTGGVERLNSDRAPVPLRAGGGRLRRRADQFCDPAVRAEVPRRTDRPIVLIREVVQLILRRTGVVNDEAVTAIAREAALEVLGADSIAQCEPMMSAEDFAFYQRKVPGCFVWLGAALNPPREHHHSDFDIDERMLPRGAALLAACALHFLRSQKG